MSRPRSIPAVVPPKPALAPAGATALAATHEGAGAAVEFGVSWCGTRARHEALNTWSVRGLPRPADDRYAGRLPLSDPTYAVWGERAA